MSRLDLRPHTSLELKVADRCRRPRDLQKSFVHGIRMTLLTLAMYLGPPIWLIPYFLTAWIFSVFVGIVGFALSFVKSQKHIAFKVGLVAVALGVINPFVFSGIWQEIYFETTAILIQAFSALLGFAAIGISLMHRPFSHGLCSRCGYDLQGNSEATHCPECGEQLNKVDLK